MQAVNVVAAPERFNASLLLDRNIDQGRAGKAAVHAVDRSLTYGELLAQASRAGNLLRALGVAREERVLLVLDDTTAFPVVFLGAMRLGAVPVPVSPLDKADNFRHFVDDSYARVVVADAGEHPDAARGARRPRPHVRLGARPGGGRDRPRGRARRPGRRARPGRRRTATTWRSGCTARARPGRPKGVVHLHHDIEITCETYARQVLGVREDDVLFSTTKLQHAYGLGNNLSFPLHFGATAVLSAGPPKPDTLLAVLRERRPTIFFSVPALYGALVRAEGAEDAFALGAHVRVGRRGAVADDLRPLPRPLRPRDRRRHRLDRDAPHLLLERARARSSAAAPGRPVPGYELRIVDEDGGVLDGEAVGNLEVRGDSCAAFYWHQHEKTKASMKGDWFTTGDRYRRTDDGVYVYEGRADDMLKIGGLWVSPVDMENAIMEHPLVDGVGVVGVTVDEVSRVAAYIIRRDGDPTDDELADELRALCKERLRRYEYPHVVRFVGDLPRTVNGKVQRFRLRELAGT